MCLTCKGLASLSIPLRLHSLVMRQRHHDCYATGPFLLWRGGAGCCLLQFFLAGAVVQNYRATYLKGKKSHKFSKKFSKNHVGRIKKNAFARKNVYNTIVVVGVQRRENRRGRFQLEVPRDWGKGGPAHPFRTLKSKNNRNGGESK